MSPRLSGRLAALCIVLFWGVMTVKLLRREVFLPSVEALRASVPGVLHAGGTSFMQEDWQGIYYGDAKVGYIHSTVRPTTGGRYILGNDARIQLRLLSRDLAVRFEGSAWVDAAGVPERLIYTVRAGPARLQVNGTREGDRLVLHVVSAGRVIEKAIAITPGLTLSNAITPSLYWPELEQGATYTLDVLDPLSLSTQPAKVRVRGREPLAYGDGMVETTVLDFEYNALTFRTWISESGVVLRQESDLGWYLVREDREQAREGLATGAALEQVLEGFATIATDASFTDPRGLRHLRAQLGGIDPAVLHLEGAHQRVVDAAQGIVEITCASPDVHTAPALPIVGLQFRPYLEPDPFVQSQDPEIIEVARRIVGGETNSWLAAQAIGDWVYRTIEKDLLASIPSAVEVLRTRRGDCNEHTTLFTALARAAGIPTRFAVGIVYNDRRYYYHAWPEVYVGRWVAMDPTFGQAVADATHIKLLEGGLLEQGRLAGVLGKLEVRVLTSDDGTGPVEQAS